MIWAPKTEQNKQKLAWIDQIQLLKVNMDNEPDHENVEQSLCAKTTDEELNKSFNLEASLSKFSYIDLDKELEFKNDLVKIQLLSGLMFNQNVG